MPDNGFFCFGDLVSNLLCGVAAALACLWLIDSDWWMLPAMVIGMGIGMLVTLLLNLALFMRLFGAMEIMIPTMLSGMLAGMWVGMRAAMTALPLLDAIGYGLLIGAVVIAFCWLANTRLQGKPRHD